MTDPDLRNVREAIESRIELGDFDEVLARGRQIRRRRQAGVLGAAALVVAGTLFGVSQPLGDNTPQPAREPTPSVIEDDARDVLRDKDAQVDTERSVVNASGALLSVVVVPSRAFGNQDAPCLSASPSAFSWIGRDGTSHAWSDHTTSRAVAAVDGGFVVGAVSLACRTGEKGEETAYFVDDRGRRLEIRWGTDEASRGTGAFAARLCSLTPSDERCRFMVSEGRGWVDNVQKPRLPGGAEPITTLDEAPLWARSADSRTVYRSDDGGATWQERTTTLGNDENVALTVAGDRVAFTTNTEVDSSEDSGSTWRVRDLSDALAPIRITDVDWTITSSGVLLGVTSRVGEGDVLFRSTDATWTAFEPVQLRTEVGLTRPVVAGPFVYVVDNERWLLSDDDGKTWRAVTPLP